MAIAESEEFAFWLQIGELNKANADYVFAAPRESDASSARFSMPENDDLRPRQLIDELHILKDVLAACCRRNKTSLTTVKPITTPEVKNENQSRLGEQAASPNRPAPKGEEIESPTNTKPSIDSLRLQEPLPLSVTKNREEAKHSQDAVDHEHLEQLPLSGKKSCDSLLPKLASSSSKNPLEEQRIDELLMELVAFRNHRIMMSHDTPEFIRSEKRIEEAALRHKGELHLDKDLLDMHSEMLAREHQIWQDELLARKIETENLKLQSFMESNNLTNISHSQNPVCDLFFAEAQDDLGYVGVGCVMKDAEGQVIFENRECLGIEVSHHFAEYTALINGLAYARSTGVRRINAYGHRAFLFWEFQGVANVWTTEQLNLMDALQNQVMELSSFNVNCCSRAENADAINLAKRAIVLYRSQGKNRKDTSMRFKGKSRLEEDNLKECLICLDKIFPSDMVCQNACDHRFCFNCLSQHVETEIATSKVPVRCPQFFTCARHMDLDECQRLVNQQIFDTYTSRLAEATISESEKVYCPFPGCSAMMCRNDDKKNSRTSRVSPWSPLRRTRSACVKCMECHRLFCVECRVPWHSNLTCEQYQRLPSNERDDEDRQLLQLAKDQNWRRCQKCRSLIALAQGCFHMTCRCGYEFCYTCETQYENKKKMCKCPLFPVAVPSPRRR